MKKLSVLIVYAVILGLLFAGCGPSDSESGETKPNEAITEQMHEQNDNNGGKDDMYCVAVKNVKYEKRGLFTSYQDFGGIVRLEQAYDEVKPYSIQGECADQISVKIDEANKTIEITTTGKISKNSFEIVIYEKVSELQIENSAIRVDADFQTTKSVRITCDSLMTGTIRTQSENFYMAIEGASEIKVDGTTESAAILINGAADVSAESLVAKYADIAIEGAGKCKITVQETLNAKIDGVGSIDYYGNPSTVNKTIDGLGKITAK